MIRVLLSLVLFFFFNDTATTEISPLSLHDALPIFASAGEGRRERGGHGRRPSPRLPQDDRQIGRQETLGSQRSQNLRSEEHTSELQSRQYLVCRLLLEKKKKKLNDLHNLY